MTNTNNQTFKAVRIHAYGGPEEMTYEDVPLPTPGKGEVLVRIAAAGVNPVDGKIRSGSMKEMMPVTFPHTLGLDLAGTVEAVGEDVTEFSRGQAVYGQGSGTYAEYALASVATLASQPQSLSPLEAASIPTAAMTAWQGLFDQGGLEAGQTVLIHGASGGVGMFAVQFAKWKGARVIGTASGEGVAFVQGLGADTVIDYKTARFEDKAKDVDVVLDLIGGETQTRSFGIMKPGGILVSTVQAPSPEETRAHGVRGTVFGMEANAALLKQIGELLDSGQVKTVVTQTIPLSDMVKTGASDAHAESHAHVQGKTVLQVTQ